MSGRLRAGCSLALLALSLAGPGTVAAAEPVSHEAIATIAIGPPAAEPFKDACGVAVGSAGRVLVANHYQHEVDIIHLGGLTEASYQGSFGTGEPPLAPNGQSYSGPCGLALDPGGDLYVENWHQDVVRYVPSGATYVRDAVIDAGHPSGIDVDQGGRLLVDDGTYVAEYEPSGLPVMNGAEPLRIGLGTIGRGYGVAVSGFPATAGRVYVCDAADDTVKAYDPGVDPEVPVEVIDGDGTAGLGFNDLTDCGLAVDPSDGHLYVADDLRPRFAIPQIEEAEAVVDEFSPAGRFRGTVPGTFLTGHPSELIAGEPTGLAISAGDIYVTSGDYYEDGRGYPDSVVKVFGPTAPFTPELLSVSKTGSGTGTIASLPPGVGCGTACVGEFDQGTTVVLVPRPAAHSRFVGWSGCTYLNGTSCAVAMEADHAVSAEFTPIPQQPLHLAVTGDGGGLVTSESAGIECGPRCGAEFDEGSEVTLFATPGPGSRLLGWSGCDSEPTPASCRMVMSGPRSAVARFGSVAAETPPPPPPPGQHLLSVLLSTVGAAGGTVSSEPGGIDCGAGCAHSYPAGQAVTLVAHPSAGSTLLGWGGCESSSGDRCEVGLHADSTVTAAFGPGASPLEVRRLAGATPILRVLVPAAGALTLSGPGLDALTAYPLRAGPVELRPRLDGRGRRRLRRARGGRLRVKVALTFTPLGGGSAVAQGAVATFRRRAGGR